MRTLTSERFARDTERALALGLTPRQSQVVALLAKGLGNREIAKTLHISQHTARVHVRELFGRLKVSNRVEAVNVLRGKVSGLHEKV